ncbi:cytochrome c4 [Bacteroidia bacterium]|nr:cytochrome c4 [Bacteroidia bacterium]GHT81807.1 cytochrome c4 [Bacteroidia bacterium]
MNPTLSLEPIPNHLENPRWPIQIAGPCSAESEEQMLVTAQQLSALNRVSYFRAGVWKPRTRPGAFEGVGEIGLKWLQMVKKETGLHTACEVATTEHVELALKYGVDLLWVGARTSVNPFSVQDIADALKGSNVNVLIKNPVNPDLQLWIGALERLNRAGITRLAVIHRGFSSFEKTPFRNAPMWNMAVELRALCPQLPVIGDPSHIAGIADLVPLIAQKALDMDMSGLMVEVHNNPAIAKSDAQQQLTPLQYAQMIADLQLREISPIQPQAQNELEVYRREIDTLDDVLLSNLAQRMDIARKIGNYKKKNNVMALQLSRWEQLQQQRITLAKTMGVSPDFTKKFLALVHEESLNLQTDIMNN